MLNNKIKASLLYMGSTFVFAVVQLFVKLSAVEVGTFEQTFVRNFISLFIAYFMVRREKLDIIKEVRGGGLPLWSRSFFGFLGVLLYFYAAANGRQADVAMLSRSSPIFVAFFAAIILHERMTSVKIAAALIGLVGAYVAMQPSFDSDPLPLIAALLQAFASGITYTSLALCKNRVHAHVVVLHFSVFSTICAGLLMIPSFVIPSPKCMIYLVMIGVFAAAGQFLLTYSYRMAPASEISVYGYTGVLFSAILGYAVLQETLASTSIAGGLIILISVWLMYRYQKRIDNSCN